MKESEKNWEKMQVFEQKETNSVLWLNTAFTILTGISTVVLAWLQYKK